MMNFFKGMSAIDNWVVTKYAQPVADYIERWMNCYALAAFLLTGSILGFAVYGIHEEKWFSLFIWSILVPREAYFAYRMAESEPSTVRPTHVLRMTAARGFTIILLPVDFYVLFFPSNPWWRLEEASWLAMVFAFFMMAAHRRPPSSRSSTKARGSIFGRLSSVRAS